MVRAAEARSLRKAENMKTSHIGLVLLLVIALVAGSAEAAKPKQKQKSRAEVKREAIAGYRQVQEQATKFLVPEFYVDGQSQIRNIAFTRRGSDIEVVWSGNPNRMYEIHRSTEQRFSASFSTQIGTAIGNSFTDWGALKLRPVRYYYQVIER